MLGDAITKPGTPHYAFHESMEQFWSSYRKGGDLYLRKPTNAESSTVKQLNGHFRRLDSLRKMLHTLLVELPLSVPNTI
jgi:hypothetical protein